MGTAPGFFDVDDRLKRLSDLGDQLEAYRRVVDFEAFRPDLEKALADLPLNFHLAAIRASAVSVTP